MWQPHIINRISQSNVIVFCSADANEGCKVDCFLLIIEVIIMSTYRKKLFYFSLSESLNKPFKKRLIIFAQSFSTEWTCPTL